MEEKIIHLLINPFMFPWIQTHRIYFVYLFSSILIGVLIYYFSNNKSNENLFKYIFPSSIYTHLSARQDYKFFYLTIILEAIILIPLVTFITPVIALFVVRFLNYLPINMISDAKPIENGMWLAIFYTFISVVIADFALFYAHYLQHKIPWLWQFHKVHHTAKVLTPITLYRMHPIDNLLTYSLVGLLLGITQGFFQFFTGPDAVIIDFMGVNVFFGLFYIMGYNLRHSHIWFDFGPVLDHIFISPAQHQIHHSSEKRHLDKNMGLMFAFWDYFFNTLYIPKEKENFELGITSQKEQEEFEGSALKLFWMPFVCIYEQIKNKGFKKSSVLASSILLICLLIMGITTIYAKSKPENPCRKLYIENLTWVEVEDKIKSGFITAIIPIGGIEQNGPHVSTGKHNKIVVYAAGKIAEVIGKTLIAPVINETPEGGSIHNNFPGTITIPDDLFEQLLISNAYSLKRQGFKRIYFLGDSGGSQSIQEKVANKLNNEWKKENITVASLSDYYSNNGQQKWLINKGIKIDDIGDHAGIKDTSELLFISPDDVRKDKLANNKKENFHTVGAFGDSRHASEVFGHELIELKINSAIRQIKQLS